MAAPGVGGIASIVWVLMLFGPRVEFATAAESPAIELRLGARGGLDDAGLRRMERTVGELLASAGISADWHDCRPQETCESDHRGCPRPVADRVEDDRRRGVRGVRSRSAIRRADRARVSAPRRRMQQAIRGGIGRARSARRWPPRRDRRSLGLIIAHEVGHALGLPHGRTGVMKARPSVDDVIALRLSTLAFQHKEAVVMRLAIIARSEELLAQVR